MKLVKKFTIIFSTLLAITLLTACNDDMGHHVHELVNDDAILATCTTDGLTEGRHCLLCDYKEGQEIIPALGHSIIIDKMEYPTCYSDGLTEGSHCSRCNKIIIEQEVINAVDHYFITDTNDNFFDALCMYGCGTFGIEQSHQHDNFFKFTFNTDEGYSFSDLEEEINETIEYLNKLEKYDENKHSFVKDSQLFGECNNFIDNYEQRLNSIIHYIKGQFQLERFYKQYLPSNNNNEDYYNDIEYAYYFVSDSIDNITVLIYESCLKDYYFRVENGYTEEFLENLYENIYGIDESVSSPLDDLNKRINEIKNEYYNLNYDQFYGKELNELYAEYIYTFNEIVKLQYGSIDENFNAYDVIYNSVYKRQYSPKDAEVLRSHVLKYLKDVQSITFELGEKCYNKILNDTDNNNLSSADRISYSNVFKDAGVLSLIGDYFKTLNNATNDTPATIDFYVSLNEMLKNHDYFEDVNHETAFSYVLQDIPILCFSSNRVDASTFVHEAGHYMHNIYNPNIYNSSDYNEFQSQCNELLFYLYYSTLNKEVGDFLLSQYINEKVLVSILLLCITDEFEYELFKADAIGKPISPDNYRDLLISILKKYDMLDWGESSVEYSVNYWRYYSIDDSGLMISYVCGKISTIEMFINFYEKGYEVVKDDYLKLFTYTDDLKNPDYFELLDYLGLSNVLDEDFYANILSFFKNDYIKVIN